MLIKCPECELSVSDKALSCPHCGFPLKEKGERKGRPLKNHKRLPNGFGQITELRNQNLRNRFRASVTVGKNDEGRFIQKLLKPVAYFRTYNEAYEALVEYHKNPYDLEDDITVGELYDKWTEAYFKTLKSESSIRTITSSWQYCAQLRKMRAKDVRAHHLKDCIDTAKAEIKGEIHEATPGIKARIKSLFNLMFDYAVEYEIIERNYARTFALSDDIITEKEELHKSHIPFTDDEMKTLWDNVKTMPIVDMILIQCYSGWRPQELILLELENINFEDWTFVGGMKTDAGTNRVVPIHERIRPLIKKNYQEALSLGSKYLFNCTDAHTHRSKLEYTYEKYNYRFNKVVQALKLNEQHRPHDPRCHFITMAKKYEVDEYAIKYMVGHTITDLTEKVYTTRSVDWLKMEISKIK